MNQSLASFGYIVLSVNYRSGIGYGLNFREALNYGATGASEFNDVMGAGLYLKNRPDVDGARIGSWGGSYGGYLTPLALSPRLRPLRRRRRHARRPRLEHRDPGLFARLQPARAPRRRAPGFQLLAHGFGLHLALAGAADSRRRRSQRSLRPGHRTRRRVAQAKG